MKVEKWYPTIPLATTKAALRKIRKLALGLRSFRTVLDQTYKQVQIRTSKALNSRMESNNSKTLIYSHYKENINELNSKHEFEVASFPSQVLRPSEKKRLPKPNANGLASHKEETTFEANIKKLAFGRII